MRRIKARWALFFFGLLLLPVTLLIYSSVQSLQDERRSVIADQQFMATLLQEVFGDLVDQIARHIAYAPAPDIDLSIYDSYAEVKHAFALDANGNLTYPLVLPLSLDQRRDTFDRALARGQTLEFSRSDHQGAEKAYWAAWKEAHADGESAEVLNALGRCALAQNDVDAALELHRKLTFYTLSFDADGAHPVSLSYLRLARHLGPETGAPLLAQWIKGLLDNHYPSITQPSQSQSQQDDHQTGLPRSNCICGRRQSFSGQSAIPLPQER